MAQTELRLQASFIFTVPQDEMLLILKALGGRLKDSEIDRARALGNKLTEQRAKELEGTALLLRRALQEE